jgi:hypothetical protein
LVLATTVNMKTSAVFIVLFASALFAAVSAQDDQHWVHKPACVRPGENAIMQVNVSAHMLKGSPDKRTSGCAAAAACQVGLSTYCTAKHSRLHDEMATLFSNQSAQHIN